MTGSVLCNGECTVFQTDPLNCGGCVAQDAGMACATGQVCEQGMCKATCTLGVSTQCNGSCVDTMTDTNNCGGCGVICDNAQSCRAGHCSWDLVAACFTTGQIVGVSSVADVRGPLQSLGTGPISLASYGPVLLAADNLDNRLLQASLPSLAPLSNFNQTGAAPNQVITEGAYVYVVNSVGHTLQILTQDAGCPQVDAPDAGCAFVALADGGTAEPLMGDGGCFLPATTDGGCADTLLNDGGLGPFTFADGGCFVVPLPPPAPFMPCTQGDAGVGLVTIGELDFGANTFPQAIAKLGSAVWVPLYGGFGSSGATAGQKVIQVDVTNPASPASVGTVDLSTLNLHAFDGGSPVARPYSIVTLNGKLYVALNNLNPDTYVPEGPGLLAVIDPANLTGTTEINLGANTCLDPVCVFPANSKLFVSCAGHAVYDVAGNYALLSTSHSGVLTVDPSSGMVTAQWTPSCPADAGLPDGGSSCLPILPSRLAVTGTNVFMGDQNGGRIFVLDAADGGLTEKAGYSGYAGGPIQACGIDPILGFSNVADILPLP
jgi:hypothetical protein